MSNKKGSRNVYKYATVILVIVVVVGALFYFGQGKISGLGNGGSTAQLYFAGTVTYSDGTTAPFDSRTAGHSLAFMQGGKSIQSVNTNAYMNVIYTGSASSYILTGTFGMIIQDMATGSNVYSTTMAFQPTSTPTLVSNTPLLITSSTVSQSALQSLYSGWVSGRSYQLVDSIANAGITITFADGGQASASSQPASCTLSFTYSNDAIQSLTITFAQSTT